jgi:hypothetical protein
MPPENMKVDGYQMRSSEEVVELFFSLYNKKDFSRLRQLLGDEMSFVHHNRGMACSGASDFVNFLERMAPVIPDRAYRDINVIGRGLPERDQRSETVIVSSTWGGTPAMDYGADLVAGQPMAANLISVFTVVNGIIEGVQDYG